MNIIPKLKKITFQKKSSIRKVKNSRISIKKNLNIKNLKIFLLKQKKVKLNFKQIKYVSKKKLNSYKTKLFKKGIFKQGKFSYEFFNIIKGYLKYSKECFNSVNILNKLSIKNLFQINLNLNYLYQRLFFLKKKYIKNIKYIFKKYIRNFLKKSKRLVLRSFNNLEHIKFFQKRKIAINKGIKFILNKTLFRNRQRIFYILNYGFFFTFLLKSNNTYDLAEIFNKKFFLFEKNKLFLMFFLRKLYKNYFFINNFIGSYNRFFFNSKDITINFSDYFNLNLVNLSHYNSYKKFNFIKLDLK